MEEVRQLSHRPLPQRTPGTGKQGFQSVDADPHHRGRIVPGQALLVTERERGPLPLGKGAERAGQPAIERLSLQPPTGVGSRIGRIEPFRPRQVPAAAQAVDAEIVGNPVEPWPKAPRRRTPLTRPFPNPQEGILGNILGLGGIAEHPPGKPDKRGEMALDQDAAGDRIAPPHLPQKRFVGGLRGCPRATASHRRRWHDGTRVVPEP